MAGAIRIEVHPLGFIHINLIQPNSGVEADRLWMLYRALLPQIRELEIAARQEGPRLCVDSAIEGVSDEDKGKT